VNSITTGRSFRIKGAGRFVFAATMIGVGILGLIKGDFTVIWQPVPRGIPAREVLAYLCAFVSLFAGAGLLWRRTSAFAAVVLLTFLVVWFLLWRLRLFFVAPLIQSSWSCGETAVMAGAVCVLFAEFAAGWFRQRLGFATGDKGVRLATVLYGLGLIPFGYAHFANVKGTADLVPGWLPWHLFWAYLTGVTFIAAGLAIGIGLFARLAASLSALQMGMFGLLVWVPIVVRGSINPFQLGEFITTLVLTAAAWVVSDFFRKKPWLAAGRL